ncbi:MAG: hypothetical protein OXF50_14580 [Caldilineaceae bacterium]|nr:hypothetical protein [Caldilineaceae bacterium]
MSVRPLVLWVTRQEETVMRFTRRDRDIATGILTDANGTVPFAFDRVARRLSLPARDIYLDEYGWEVDEKGQIVFQSRRSDQE